MIPRTASNAAWLLPGSKLDRYELLLPIAEGGMAMLWLARQQGKHGFDRVVAIKTILPKLAAEPGFRQMFLDEARLASRIEHVHVAQVLDLGEENGVLFMAMEWVDSESLINLGRSVARSKNAMFPIGILARIMADASAGLHAAHELKDDEGRPLNVVHRDISPHNLLISYRGITKIIDFGIAKARNRLAHDTNVGTVKGKIAYMAPEQAMGHETDRRADVWGAGATLYRYLAGRAPFSAANPIATLRLLTSGQPAPPLPTSVPKPMRLVVEKALELEVNKRFKTMDEMRLALEDAMRQMEMVTTHTDVETFMSSHLGEARLAREGEISSAVRESRSRTRATIRRSPSRAEIARASRSDTPPAQRIEPDEAPMTPEKESLTRTRARKPVEGAPEPGGAAEADDDFDRRRTMKLKPKTPARGSVAPTAPEGIKLPTESPSMRRALMTPPALQIAAVSLTGTSQGRVPLADRASSAKIPVNAPTPPWIRMQPQLAAAPSSAPADDEPGGKIAAEGETVRPGSLNLPSDVVLTDPPRIAIDLPIDNVPSGLSSFPIMLKRRTERRLATMKIHVAKGVSGVFVLVGVVLALQFWSPAAPKPMTRGEASAQSTSTAAHAAADALVLRAKQAAHDGDLVQAKALYAQAVTEAPNDAEALVGLAELEQGQGATASAIADYRRAMLADGSSLPARLGLADSLWADGQQLEAQALYQGIVDNFPANAQPDRARQRAKGP
jgi:serine/threonine protein kinase